MRSLVLALLLPAFPLQAEGFRPVSDRNEFLSLIEGHALRHGLLNITLEVRPDGTIQGDAVRWPVSGTWAWQDGYFCRRMDWSGKEIPFNCQLVEANGDRLRFTVDRGAGDSATFRLR